MSPAFDVSQLRYIPISISGIAIEFAEIGEQEKEIINTTVQEFLEYKFKLL